MGYSKYEEQYDYQQDDEIEITNLDLPDNTGDSLLLLAAQRFVKWQRSLTHKSLRRFFTVGIVLLTFLAVWPNIQSSLFILSPLRNNLLALFSKQQQSSSTIMSQSPPVTIKPSMVFLPERDGFACVVDATWSPDSKYVALLGYQGVCEMDSHGGGRGARSTSVKLLNGAGSVVIHDALSGKKIGQIQPARPILEALRTQFP